MPASPARGPQDVKMLAMALTERDLAVLACEGSWWVGEAAPRTKAEAIAGLGMSRRQYYATLQALVDGTEGERLDPLVVRRVRRARAERRRTRFEGRQTRAGR